MAGLRAGGGVGEPGPWGANGPLRPKAPRQFAKEESMEAYCMKDKKKVEMQNPQPITMKNGKPATAGTCPVCGTKVFKIGKAS
jgi:hypothetical protein